MTRISLPRRFGSALLALAFAFGMMLVPSSGLAQQTTTARTRNAAPTALVQGAVAGTSNTFSGVLNISNFLVQNGQLVAQGTIAGNVLDATGNVIQAIPATAATLLVSSASASCPILSLTLGPLHLTVLGLEIDLNQVNLNIVAQPGAGNLLGNLLCSVANLLNGGGALSQIAGLLNQILGILGGL